ncbi:hypothetical protein ACVWZK_006619 [Bradyrhizobium sp. GM0.4]
MTLLTVLPRSRTDNLKGRGATLTAYQYGHNIVGRQFGSSTFLMTVQEFDDSLRENATNLSKRVPSAHERGNIVADRWFAGANSNGQRVITR